VVRIKRSAAAILVPGLTPPEQVTRTAPTGTSVTELVKVKVLDEKAATGSAKPAGKANLQEGPLGKVNPVKGTTILPEPSKVEAVVNETVTVTPVELAMAVDKVTAALVRAPTAVT